MTSFLDQLAPLSPALEAVRERGESQFAGLQIHPYEARLLQLLVRLSGAQRAIEIGAFVGLSSLAMLEAMGEGGSVLTCERNPEHAAIAREHFAGKAITLFEGDGLEMIAQADGVFDLAFIDAEKRKYPLYLEALLPKLKQNALILADNSLLKGAVESGDAQERVSNEAIREMRKLHEILGDRSRFETVTLPTSDGLTIAIKRF